MQILEYPLQGGAHQPKEKPDACNTRQTTIRADIKVLTSSSQSRLSAPLFPMPLTWVPADAEEEYYTKMKQSYVDFQNWFYHSPTVHEADLHLS